MKIKERKVRKYLRMFMAAVKISPFVMYSYVGSTCMKVQCAKRTCKCKLVLTHTSFFTRRLRGNASGVKIMLAVIWNTLNSLSLLNTTHINFTLCNNYYLPLYALKRVGIFKMHQIYTCTFEVFTKVSNALKEYEVTI